MQFNGGCADANTGRYATIRDRTTFYLEGIATSTESDSSTVVTCLDDNLMARFVEHPDLPPVDLLMPPFRPDLGEYGKIWSADTKNDLNQDVCSWHDPDPVLDPFRHRIHSHGTIASSYAHQLELFFAIAAFITPNSFETRLDTPAAVAADFAEELLVSAMGTKLIPRELLRMSLHTNALLAADHYAAKGTPSDGVESVVMEPSGHEAREDLPHAIEDSYKLLENMRDMSTLSVQYIKNNLMLLRTSIAEVSGAYKWQVVELRTARVPASWADVKLMMRIADFIATVFEELKAQQAVLERAQDEICGLNPLAADAKTVCDTLTQIPGLPEYDGEDC
ncbi:hypothetical protein HDU87_001139 [Geranomyces variabilis]|uniref:Uncharacterized protein n=1 Tax=Geranomyces variabilis TaxID=109894 RepID=A0AAD5TN07_9FUNG|nr:hypothetical protein HDU87_001139 [Geranomyces variabilis]